MEERLKAYRRKKYKTSMVETVRNSLKTYLTRKKTHLETLITSEDTNLSGTKNNQEYWFTNVYYSLNAANSYGYLIILNTEKLQDTEKAKHDQFEDKSNGLQKHLNPNVAQAIYFLYFLLWTILYIIAIQVEFGAVYFVISVLMLIWMNTRTGPKKKGEISAYSVFNPNCEEIEGTLNAQQFEMEIRYGPSSIR